MKKSVRLRSGVLEVSEDDGMTWRAAELKEPLPELATRLRFALAGAKQWGTRQEVYGAVSPETAIHVADYPYGRLRTTIRYWQEERENHGVRWVSQTINPKTGRWNAPKPSTYCLFGTLVITAEGHVEHDVWSEYDSAEKAAAFVRAHVSFHTAKAAPERSMQRARMRLYMMGKARFAAALASGRAVFHINGEPRPESDEAKARHASEADLWTETARRVTPTA